MGSRIEVSLWNAVGNEHRYFTTLLITSAVTPEALVFRGRAYVLVGAGHYHEVPTHVIDL